MKNKVNHDKEKNYVRNDFSLYAILNKDLVY